MKLFLIGMPGSGKSSIAAALQAKLQIPHIDMDEELERIAGKSIQEIFDEEGEPSFRLKEKVVLEQLLKHNSAIISTGGGAACFYDNIEIMNKHGITIFLNVPVSILVQRLTAQKVQVRPMVKNKTKEELTSFLETKLNERLPFYQQATIQVEGAFINADIILKKLKEVSGITF